MSNLNWKAEIVAEGLEFPEGPVYVGPDELYFTEIHGGCVSRRREGALDARYAGSGQLVRFEYPTEAHPLYTESGR